MTSSITLMWRGDSLLIFAVPSFRIRGDCRIRFRQLSRMTGASRDSFRRSSMKTVLSEEICMIETWDNIKQNNQLIIGINSNLSKDINRDGTIGDTRLKGLTLTKSFSLEDIREQIAHWNKTKLVIRETISKRIFKWLKYQRHTTWKLKPVICVINLHRRPWCTWKTIWNNPFELPLSVPTLWNSHWIYLSQNWSKMHIKHTIFTGPSQVWHLDKIYTEEQAIIIKQLKHFVYSLFTTKWPSVEFYTTSYPSQWFHVVR